jgi:hypothetical protein
LAGLITMQRVANGGQNSRVKECKTVRTAGGQLLTH